MKRSPIVSLIGRPNVGKSSIFNRLLSNSYKAMTYDEPGVTRDRHYAILNLDNMGEKERDVILIDTGGFYPEKIEATDNKKNFEPFFNIMKSQAQIAIDESDLILFVLDVREGLIPIDKTIAHFLRQSKKEVWFLINKYDTDKQAGHELEFYELGFEPEQMILTSAEHNRGLIDLKERLNEFAIKKENELDEGGPQNGVKPNYEVVANLAIIGAPNVGKSTLLNRLVGSDRALVSDIAGTTVDPIEGYFDLYFGKGANILKAQDNDFIKSDQELLQKLKDIENIDIYLDDDDFELDPKLFESDDDQEEFDQDDMLSDKDDEISLEELESKVAEALRESEIAENESTEVDSEEHGFRSIKLVDTAGIRRQKSVKGFVETQSVYRSLRAIADSDIVLLMCDATIGITHHDRRLADIALEKGKSLILCLNKVDQIKDIMKDQIKKREWLLDLRAKIPWLSFCELITISALKGSYIRTLQSSIIKTVLVRHKKIKTGELNRLIRYLVDKNPIMLDKARGVPFKVKYTSMLKSTPPTFLFFTNRSQGIPVNFKRYLKNNIRSEFELRNTPVHLIFRTTGDLRKRIKQV